MVKKGKISKASVYEKMFDEAKRLNLTVQQMKDLIAKKCKNHGTDIESLAVQLEFLKKQKDLYQYSLDDLAQWRNTATQRISALKKTEQMLIDDIEKQLNCFATALTKVQKKLDSNIHWYKSLGKIISSKIDGVKFDSCPTCCGLEK